MEIQKIIEDFNTQPNCKNVEEELDVANERLLCHLHPLHTQIQEQTTTGMYFEVKDTSHFSVAPNDLHGQNLKT